METLASVLTQQQQQLIRYDQLITHSDKSLEEVGGKCGDILHHTDEDFRCLYLNPEGREWFGLDAKKMKDLKRGSLNNFYHPDTLAYELPKIRWFYKINRGDKIYSNYQQLYHTRKQCYTICLVLTKKVRMGYLSFIFPLEKDMDLSSKIKRVILEELFKRDHQKLFDTLTRREVEVLSLLADGVNNPCIAEKLFISRHTVEQHRKNINRKLEIRNLRDILDYAYAFDLV
jgi:DNA-binding CsgD family transcriptional regulator